MKRIPLEPKYIPPGSYIRSKLNQYWRPIITITDDCVFTMQASPERAFLSLSISYQRLLEEEYEIYHPIIYPNWSPCCKEIEQ